MQMYDEAMCGTLLMFVLSICFHSFRCITAGCRKQGLHADRTSNRHFIQCVPGVVGIRYKCKNGRWNAEERRCDKIAGQQFEIAVDAEEDPPESINNFMLEWKAIEQAEEVSSLPIFN